MSYAPRSTMYGRKSRSTYCWPLRWLFIGVAVNGREGSAEVVAGCSMGGRKWPGGGRGWLLLDGGCGQAPAAACS